MTINLSYIQRLNLGALLGAQRAAATALRVIWRLQDRLSLTLEEEAAISLTRAVVDNSERLTWNAAQASVAPVREFWFTDMESVQVKQALESAGFTGADRQWLQPLIEAFFNE